MMNVRQIERLVHRGEFRQIVLRILSNGRCGHRQAIDRLTRADAIMVSALGLALQRITELTYRPTAIAAAVAQKLLGLQQRDGLFAFAGSESVTGSAAAVRALMDYADQFHAIGLEPEIDVEAGLERGLEALSLVRYDAGGLGDEIDSAIVIWQLGHREKFRSAVRFAELLRTMRQPRSHGDDLRRIARVSAA